MAKEDTRNPASQSLINAVNNYYLQLEEKRREQILEENRLRKEEFDQRVKGLRNFFLPIEKDKELAQVMEDPIVQEHLPVLGIYNGREVRGLLLARHGFEGEELILYGGRFYVINSKFDSETKQQIIRNMESSDRFLQVRNLKRSFKFGGVISKVNVGEMQETLHSAFTEVVVKIQQAQSGQVK